MRLGKNLVLSKTQRKISAILSRSISRILVIYNFFKGKRKGGISGNFRHIESKIWKISVVIIFQSRRAGEREERDYSGSRKRYKCEKRSKTLDRMLLDYCAYHKDGNSGGEFFSFGDRW